MKLQYPPKTIGWKIRSKIEKQKKKIFKIFGAMKKKEMLRQIAIDLFVVSLVKGGWEDAGWGGWGAYVGARWRLAVSTQIVGLSSGEGRGMRVRWGGRCWWERDGWPRAGLGCGDVARDRLMTAGGAGVFENSFVVDRIDPNELEDCFAEVVVGDAEVG